MSEIIVPDIRLERVINRLEDNPTGISLLPDGSIPNLRGGFIVSVTNNVVDRITSEAIMRVLSQMRQHPYCNNDRRMVR